MNDLTTLMQTKKATAKSKINGVRLGMFESPVNGEAIELVALFNGNKKTGDMIQLSVLPVNGDISENDTGRDAICGSCPLKKACYAYDQGLFAMMKSYLNGKYPQMEMEEFLKIAKNRFVRFGRFGDLSLLPYEVVKQIADNCRGFTGYTNQWRSKYFDARFTEIFMISTVGQKDSMQALKKFPDARQFRVINEKANYVNSIESGFISCPSLNGFNCDECLLCDGKSSKVGSVSIEIKAHGVDYKTKRINKMLQKDIIPVTNI
jgi:hypothetical protein